MLLSAVSTFVSLRSHSSKHSASGELSTCRRTNVLNALPHMPILGSSNSEACTDMMSKIWRNGDTITRLSRKRCGKRRNCSLRAISPFPTMFSKAVKCGRVKMSIYGVKGKMTFSLFDRTEL